MLSKGARAAIQDARLHHERIAISDKTLWELATLMRRELVTASVPTREFLLQVERLFTVLPINSAIAERAVQFSPRFPKDPSDRIIAATALIHGERLMTADGAIRTSGEVPCI